MLLSLDITRLELDILSPSLITDNFYPANLTLIFRKKKTPEDEGISNPMGKGKEVMTVIPPIKIK